MREDIFKQFSDWYVRYKGKLINLNSKETGILLLSLLEQVETLELQVHKRKKRQTREAIENDE